MSAELFGCRIDSISMDQTVARVVQQVTDKKRMVHCVVNVAKIVAAQKDEALRQHINQSDLVNIDGMGVVWGGRFLGLDIPERVAGIDLCHTLLAAAAEKGFKVFLLGATDEVLAAVVCRYQALYPTLKIVGTHHGYFKGQEKQVVAEINQQQPDMLFVAMSSPLKEQFIAKYAKALTPHFIMGVGGSFDVFAGKVKRAPQWMQRLGLEWLFRLLQEPKRMLGRYCRSNLVFLVMLIKAKGRRVLGQSSSS